LFDKRELPLALVTGESAGPGIRLRERYKAPVLCGSFAEAAALLRGEQVGALLPAFLAPSEKGGRFVRVPVPGMANQRLVAGLAWNPRMLRLNPHAARRRDTLIRALTGVMAPE
jgi:DNA-binding transcriptional LysR family regulator